MQKPHDDSKMCPAAFQQDSTLVVVVEMSLSLARRRLDPWRQSRTVEEN